MQPGDGSTTASNSSAYQIRFSLRAAIREVSDIFPHRSGKLWSEISAMNLAPHTHQRVGPKGSISIGGLPTSPSARCSCGPTDARHAVPVVAAVPVAMGAREGFSDSVRPLATDSGHVAHHARTVLFYFIYRLRVHAGHGSPVTGTCPMQARRDSLTTRLYLGASRPS